MVAESVSLAAYLPPHLLTRPGILDGSLEPPHRSCLEAGMMLVDIAGFTALTADLQEGGRAGAEEIAELVDSVFRPCIDAIERLGGSVTSFGGDSLFALFPEDGEGARAHASAAAITKVLSGLPPFDTSRGARELALSHAVHAGPVVELHLGTLDRRAYIATGAPVMKLAGMSRSLKADLTPEPFREQREDGLRSMPPVARSYLEPALVSLFGRYRGGYRQATVLFIETQGFALTAYQNFFLKLSDLLSRLGAALLKTDLSPKGTKWLAVFGIPRAHEDDADRAVCAARELLDIEQPSVRCGLHSGTIVNVEFGTKRRRSFDIFGDVVNTAARVMDQANPRELLLTETVRKLCRGLLTEEAGRRYVKGKAEPLLLHRALHWAPPGATRRGFAPLIGRQREITTIVQLLDRAADGTGAVAAILGDAGIGKSRLAWEAMKLARGKGFQVARGRANAIDPAPFGAVAELLRDLLGLTSTAPPERVRSRLHEVAAATGLSTVDTNHLGDILGAPLSGSTAAGLDSRSLRLNDLIAIREVVVRLSEKRRRLLILEDMQFADERSIEAAAWIAAIAAEQSFLLLLVGRQDYEPPLEAIRLELAELAGPEIEELLLACLGKTPGEVVAMVRERAGGNPFYVEEISRHLLESGLLEFRAGSARLARELTPEDVPSNVESVIACRLDRLSPEAREVADVASVLGRRFPADLLVGFETIRPTLGPALLELTERKILFGAGAGTNRELTFKQSLTRAVAYAGILGRRRRELHRLAAKTLETSAFLKERSRAMVGFHWEQAGEREAACRNYREAAHIAAVRFAHKEAERLFRRYLELSQEPSAERILARNCYGEKVLQLRGRYPEAEEQHRLARSEANLLGLAGAEAASLRGLALTKHETGQLDKARVFYERALDLAQECGASQLVTRLSCDLAILHHDQGRMDQARALYERAVSLASNLKLPGEEALALCNLATLHLDRGDLVAAERCYESSLAIYRRLGDRRLVGVILGNLGILYQEGGSIEAARRNYLEAIRIAEETGDLGHQGIFLGNLGHLLGEIDAFGEAIETFDRSLLLHRKSGNKRFEGVVLACRAEVELRASSRDGQEAVPAALKAELATAERLLREVDDKLELGKALCVKGHILLASGGSPDSVREEVVRLAAATKAGKESELGKARARFERAIEAQRRGERLIYGYAAGDLAGSGDGK